jgi:hypothetical protein
MTAEFTGKNLTMKTNDLLNLGTVCHTAATLLLATEKLGDGSEMIFPPVGNRYREERIKEISSLAWDIAESICSEGVRRGHITEG